MSKGHKFDIAIRCLVYNYDNGGQVSKSRFESEIFLREKKRRKKKKIVEFISQRLTETPLDIYHVTRVIAIGNQWFRDVIVIEAKHAQTITAS